MSTRKAFLILFCALATSPFVRADQCQFQMVANQKNPHANPVRAVNLVYDTGVGLNSKECAAKDVKDAKGDPFAPVTGQPYCLARLLCGKDRGINHGQMAALCPATLRADSDGKSRWMCSDDADWCYNNSVMPKGVLK